jgi:hypothetical protein
MMSFPSCLTPPDRGAPKSSVYWTGPTTGKMRRFPIGTVFGFGLGVELDVEGADVAGDEVVVADLAPNPSEPP